MAGSDRPLSYTVKLWDAATLEAVAGSDRPLSYTLLGSGDSMLSAVAGSDRPLSYTLEQALAAAYELWPGAIARSVTLM